MLIKCERCSTVYQLDEKLLPPTGAPVQCARCEHVFTARPPQTSGRTLAAFPAAQVNGMGIAGPDTLADVPLPPMEPRRDVTVGASPGTGPAAPRAPARDPRRDTLAVFAARVRSASRWRWLAPLLILVAAGGAYALYTHISGRIDPAALRQRAEGLALVGRDDTATLESAAERLGAAWRTDRKLYQALADRSLALALLSAALRDEAAPLEARWKELEGRGAARSPDLDELKSLGTVLEPLNDRARQAREEAFSQLRGLSREHGRDPAVLRALALFYGLDGNASEGARFAAAARAAPGDPWVDLAEGVTAGIGGGAERAAVAAARLGPLAASHPEMLRARLLLARAQANLGERDAAVTTLDAILADNPAHAGARRLKAELLAPPPVGPVMHATQMGPSSAPGGAARVGSPGLLPRKTSSH